MEPNSPSTSPTPQPATIVHQPPRTSPILISLLLLVLIVSAVLAGFLYLQNQSLQNQITELTRVDVIPTPTSMPDLTPTPEASPTASSLIPTITLTPAATSSPTPTY